MKNMSSVNYGIKFGNNMATRENVSSNEYGRFYNWNIYMLVTDL
jgi:hypothetical protein